MFTSKRNAEPKPGWIQKEKTVIWGCDIEFPSLLASVSLSITPKMPMCLELCSHPAPHWARQYWFPACLNKMRILKHPCSIISVPSVASARKYVMGVPHEYQQNWTFQKMLLRPFPSETLLLLGFMQQSAAQPEATKYSSLLNLMEFKPIINQAGTLIN